MSDKLEPGDRVVLTGKGIIPTPSWPLWGSDLACVGTVVHNDMGSLVGVLWDNGKEKIVLDISLSYYTGTDKDTVSPNIAFLQYKRKQQCQD